MSDQEPIVSIVVPTKNRPDKLQLLISDILKQELQNFECIIVDDESTTAQKDQYRSIIPVEDKRFIYLEIAHDDPRSRGPSRARNTGILAASGQFVAFCDDDDRWIQNDHLKVAVHNLVDHDGTLFFAAMRYSEKIKDQFLYTPALPTLMKRRLSDEIYMVDIASMAKCLSLRTLHSDTIVARRSTVIEAGLYNERILISEDREFSYRLVDCSKFVLFRNVVCAELNISQHQGVYRSIDRINQCLYAYQATIRGIFSIKNKALRQAALKVASWDFIEICVYFIGQGDRPNARLALRLSISTYPNYEAIRLFYNNFRIFLIG